MRILICTLLCLATIHLLHGEITHLEPTSKADSIEVPPKNAIMLAPLGHMLNGSKSSIYYKRVLNQTGKFRTTFRIGTEGLGSILSSYSTKESRVDAFNLKLGLELDYDFDGFHIYLGPELGQTTYSSSRGLLRVRDNNTLFSTSTVSLNRDIEVNSSEVIMVSGHIFLGLKFDVAEKVAIGIEAAFGYGRWELETEYPNAQNPVTNEGERYDFNLSRFIFAEFKF